MIRSLVGKLWSWSGRLLRSIPGTSIAGSLWSKAGRHLDDITWFVIYVVLAFIFFCALTGCSAAKKIANENAKVNQAATDIRTEVVVAKQNLHDNNLPAVEDNLDTIDSAADAIQKSTVIVQKELTQVQDKIPAWLTTIKWVGVAIVALVVVFLMWRFNLFLIAEKAIQGLVNLIAKALGA